MAETDEVIEISVIERVPAPHSLVLNFMVTRGMVHIAGKKGLCKNI
jgi:hypothetical protein